MVAATDLKFVDRKIMWVRVPPRAQNFTFSFSIFYCSELEASAGTVVMFVSVVAGGVALTSILVSTLVVVAVTTLAGAVTLPPVMFTFVDVAGREAGGGVVWDDGALVSGTIVVVVADTVVTVVVEIVTVVVARVVEAVAAMPAVVVLAVVAGVS